MTSLALLIVAAYLLSGGAVAVLTHVLWPHVEPVWVTVPAALLAVAVRLAEAGLVVAGTGRYSLADLRLERLALWLMSIAVLYLTLWRLKAQREIHAAAAPAIQPLVDVSETMLASAKTLLDTPGSSEGR